MSHTTASILDHAPGRIRFAVDAVAPAPAPLPTVPLGPRLAATLGGPLLATSHPDITPVVPDDAIPRFSAPAQLNPLVATVHHAFSQHRPLTLGPDALWLTIAQGFAHHVSNHHEQLRDRLVRHDGKRPLTITRTSLRTAEDWAGAIGAWADALVGEVGPGLVRVLSGGFSTTTPAARVAHQVALMDAFQRYFDYRELTICGIPQVTLLGTPDDWRQVRERVEVLAEYDLLWWVARLRPIADALIASAEGRPPLAFWQQIYKPHEAYGGDVVTGWLADLFPYITDPISRGPTVRNPLLARPREELDVGRGLPPASFPSGLSQVPCHLSDSHQVTTVHLAGGLIGVTQADDGALTPLLGWAVVGPDAFSAQLDRLAAHGARAAPIAWGSSWRSIPELPKEGLQLLDHFHGTRWFADSSHPWQVREPEELTRIEITPVNFYATLLIDLLDGRSIGFHEHTSSHWTYGENVEEDTYHFHEELWVIVGRPAREWVEWREENWPFLPLDTVRVIARGVPEFVARLLAAGGAYYFDAPDFVPDAVITPRQLGRPRNRTERANDVGDD